MYWQKKVVRKSFYPKVIEQLRIPAQISVYDDRIYFANDCIFPENWTIDDLKGRRKTLIGTAPAERK